MSEIEDVHQGEETLEEEVVDLAVLENESLSDDEEPEVDDDGQEPIDEIPELGIENATEDDQKLWSQRWNGLLKREKRVSATEKELKPLLDNKDRVGQLLHVEQALGSPDQALPVLGQIVAELKRQHRFTDEEVAKALGFTRGGDAEELSFDSDTDVYRRAKEDAKKELVAEFGSKFEKLEKAEAERAQRQELSQRIEKHLPSIMKRVSELSGVKVNLRREQIEAALLAEPEIAKNDPAKAVYVHYTDLIKKVRARQTRTGDRKGHELVKSTPRSGSQKTPSKDLSFSERARQSGLDPTSLFKEMFEI